jgi:hypothetical protein
MRQYRVAINFACTASRDWRDLRAGLALSSNADFLPRVSPRP